MQPPRDQELTWAKVLKALTAVRRPPLGTNSITPRTAGRFTQARRRRRRRRWRRRRSRRRRRKSTPPPRSWQAPHPASSPVLRGAKRNKRGSAYKASGEVGKRCSGGACNLQTIWTVLSHPLFADPLSHHRPRNPSLPRPAACFWGVLGNRCATLCRRDGGFGAAWASREGDAETIWYYTVVLIPRLLSRHVWPPQPFISVFGAGKGFRSVLRMKLN